VKRTIQERLELAYFEGYQDGAAHVRKRNPYSLPRGADPELDGVPKKPAKKRKPSTGQGSK
jgi:hypothetical protein